MDMSDLNVRVSPLWARMRKDFGSANSALRGYGLSRYSKKRTAFYLKALASLRFPLRVAGFALNLVDRLFAEGLSLLVFGRRAAGRKFGLSTYRWPNPLMDKTSRLSNSSRQAKVDYSLTEVQGFIQRFEKHGLGLSHNSMKAFSYLQKLESYIGPYRNAELKVLEVGAGLMNFAHLLSLSQHRLVYVVIDLPEMLHAARLEIERTYRRCGAEYEIFRWDEVSVFKQSRSPQKVLLVENDKFDSFVELRWKFDLFVNHESFSEMPLTTVNHYLTGAERLLRGGAMVNLVNRLSRPQMESDQMSSLQLSDVTDFRDYNLRFCDELVYEIDSFRSRIREQQAKPNIFFLGRVKADSI